MKQWWNSLTARGRAATGVAGIAALLIVIGGGVGAAADTGAARATAEATATSRVTATSASGNFSTSVPTAAPGAVVTVQRVESTETIPFDTVTVEDATLARGTSAVTRSGHAGTAVRTYDVTSADGVELRRVLISEVTTVAAISQQTSIGTR